MDITQLPFNRLIGLERSTSKGGLFQLSDDPKYRNHVDTVHASALYALAESSSGEFLMRQVATRLDLETLLPVVRRAEIKYRKAATGAVWARGVRKEEDWESFFESYDRRKRATIGFEIELLSGDDDGLVATARYEWFATERPAASA